MKMTEKEFLMNLLSIPSVNGENSEKDIAVYIQQFMVESGIDAQIQFIDEKHANVVAKLQGKSSEIIIWNGHMDTVPYGDEQYLVVCSAFVLSQIRIILDILGQVDLLRNPEIIHGLPVPVVHPSVAQIVEII